MDMTVAIAGASAGFGEATARVLAEAGARVVLIGRREARLKELAADLPKGHACVLACDIRDADAYPKALSSLPAPFSEIDALVNNAGLGLGRDPAQSARLQDWLTMVETNINGLLLGTHSVLPGMVARGRGHIVNIGSVVGEYPMPANAVYGPTKAFVRQFSLCLRADLLGTPVRVTDVSPGLAGGTEFSVVKLEGDEAMAGKVYEGLSPLTAADVADAVHWALTRPAHVNVNVIELMPVDQAFGPPGLARRS